MNIQAHTSAITYITFNHDGSLVATTSKKVINLHKLGYNNSYLLYS